MIRIGYACVNTELPTAGRTFRLANYSEQRMLEVASANVKALERILQWNADHGIHLFRITSNLVPFGSHLVNSGAWKHALSHDFTRIGRFVRENGMRVSMHPGQYSVLNSPFETTHLNTLRELAYHEAVFSLMDLDDDHTIVIHGGGAYGNKDKATRVLVDRLAQIDSAISRRLVLENDERVFTARDILAVCRASGVPGVLDVFHHRVLSSFPGTGIREIVEMFAPTWAGRRQKIHYSDQEPGKVRGSHSAHADIEEFRRLYGEIVSLDLDIMIEVKDKQKSVLALKRAFPDLA